ncbi:MAG: ribonuclease P protein component [Faecalibacterium sp.]|nr:ribonuclease P protein component [Faecalibacterium sp.]
MKYHTLCRNGEFSRVYARGKSYVHPQLVLYVLKTRARHTRVGLTATKKIGHAVDRNRARRVMRAAIAEHLPLDIGGYDLVFVARGRTPHVKSTVLSIAVARLLAQAGLPDKAAEGGTEASAALCGQAAPADGRTANAPQRASQAAANAAGQPPAV